MKNITLTTTLLFSFASITYASDVTIPNTFSAGSPAVAADVNANFSAVESAVDDNNARVTTNTGNISTNAANISSNTTGVSTNAASITTNASGISGNAANITANANGVAANAGGVAGNAGNISTNATNIGTNSGNISTNAGNISTNTSGITTNASAISNNTANIATNAGNITNNGLGIATNVSGISTNAAGIATNAAAIAAIPSITVYDYRNYISTGTSKTFSIKPAPGTSWSINCGDTEVRTEIRTPNGANTDITDTRIQTNSGTPCRHFVFRLTNTPTERLLKEKDVYNTTTTLLSKTLRLEEPVTLMTSNMTKGSAFGDASMVYETPAGGSEVLAGAHVQNVSITGIESVTVPLGTYTNCIKVVEQRDSWGFGGTTDTRVSWRCPGLGEVKRIESKQSGGYGMFELTAVTP